MSGRPRLPFVDDPTLMTYQRIARLIRRHRGELSRTARNLARELALTAGPDGSVWYTSVEMLADELGVTAATIRRARAELVAAGVVQVTLEGGGTDTNVYRFALSTPRALDAQTPRADARHRGRDLDEEEEERSSPPIEPWVLARYPSLVAKVTIDALPTGTSWEQLG